MTCTPLSYAVRSNKKNGMVHSVLCFFAVRGGQNSKFEVWTDRNTSRKVICLSNLSTPFVRKLTNKCLAFFCAVFFCLRRWRRRRSKIGRRMDWPWLLQQFAMRIFQNSFISARCVRKWKKKRTDKVSNDCSKTGKEVCFGRSGLTANICGQLNLIFCTRGTPRKVSFCPPLQDLKKKRTLIRQENTFPHVSTFHVCDWRF